MKPQLHKIPLASDHSFLFEQLECNYFDKPWHFHEEYELVMIVKGSGTKFIGDSVSLFDEGELVLIGSNIPHFFRCSEDYYKKNSQLTASSVFIHFNDDFLGNSFFEVPEMKLVKRLLDNASYALQIQGKVRKTVMARLLDLIHRKPAEKLLGLLDILIQLSESKDLKPLLSNAFVARNKLLASGKNQKDTERIHKVFEYIMRNYRRQIYLGEAAALLNMSSVSFSRYFKHHTRKTFSEYVTRVRISQACNLLMHDNNGIAQISYASGFENLSNFYRHFRRITGVVPKDYRTRFLKS